MVTLTRSSALFLLVIVLQSKIQMARAGSDRPLTEETLTKLIELQIDDSAIVSKLKQGGIGFAVDEATVGRLRKVGASSAVISEVQAAGSARQASASARAVTYHDVLKLLQIGLKEKDIIERLEKSPTHFTLDAGQVEALKQAGATEALLSAMQKSHSSPHPTAGPRITDFAVVLDCSGSMAEQTRDGQIKIDVAKRVVSELINQMPEKLRVTLVIYGYDRDLNCQAVQVARPLSELRTDGKSELAAIIGALRPVGNTPIAQALEITGQELAKNDAPCGMVLLTDGKETCGGNPVEVTTALSARLRLAYGINVIGFDVREDERTALAALAQAGKGNYYQRPDRCRVDRDRSWYPAGITGRRPARRDGQDHPPWLRANRQDPRSGDSTAALG
jgi:Mg-chelatase subunit ChlD